MTRLAVRHVRYRGDTYAYDSPVLADGVCVLVGANGTGKTTFSDFVYFCLGGRVPKFERKGDRRHIEITGDSNNHVELEVQIGESQFTIRRYIGRSEIGVIPEEGKPEVFHIFRQHATSEQRVFSDWLLERLGIRPVTLFQGSRSWTLGFRDLARLIYHDQEPNPEHVFRRPDQDGITESAYVRRAIFEILTGRGFQELYDLHGEVRRLEEDLSGVTAQARSFESALQVFLDVSATKNLEHLTEVAEQLQRELRSLESERDAYVSVGPPDEGDAGVLAELQRELAEASERIAAVRKERRLLMGRLADLEEGRVTLLHEATAIEKILYTDRKTGLFATDDVCPFCYCPVERSKGHCICGAAVGEGNYRAFFYSPQEYNDILREKRKALATVDASAERSRTRLAELGRDEQAKLEALASAERAIREKRQYRSGQQRANKKLAEVETRIRSVERRLKETHQQLKIERERERLLSERAELEDRLKRKRAQVKTKEGLADQEMADIREAFQSRYTELLRRLVPNARTATLSDSYDPIMNLGEYVEASARVPFRLLYFGVLLEMSLKNTEMPFPRFLLIDTPETAGIDKEKLLEAIETLQEISSSSSTPHQIILTTGQGRYPSDLEARVFGRLTEDARLLQRNAAPEPNTRA